MLAAEGTPDDTDPQGVSFSGEPVMGHVADILRVGEGAEDILELTADDVRMLAQPATQNEVVLLNVFGPLVGEA